MAKFPVMKFNESMMAVLGIYQHSFASPSLNVLRLLGPYLVTISLILSNTFAIMYAYQEPNLSFKLEAIALLIGATEALFGYLNLKWKVDKAGQLNGKMQEIVDQAIEQKTVATAYWMAEQNCSKYIKKLSVFVLFQTFSIVFAFFFSIYCICIGNVDTLTYFLPLRLAPPFSVATMLGWYSFWLYQFIDIIAFLGGTITAALHFGGYCFYLHALCDHFDYLIRLADDELRQNRRSKPKEEFEWTRSLIARKHLSNAIDHHNTIYEMFTMLADISSGGIFAFLTLSSIYLGISFYNLEHSGVDVSSAEGIAAVIFAIAVVLCGLMWPFLLCHYGTHATERIQSIDLAVYNASWLHYPPNLQKWIILIMAQSQSNISFNGFNLVGCTLETFSKICNSSCSYYLIFRRFTQR